MRLKVFSYVVLLHPCENDEDIVNTRIIKHKQFHLAANQDAAKIDALRDLPDAVPSDQVEVIVRPF